MQKRDLVILIVNKLFRSFYILRAHFGQHLPKFLPVKQPFVFEVLYQSPILGHLREALLDCEISIIIPSM